MQIAIDTSTDTASIALVRDGEYISELTWRSRQNHTVELLPNLTFLLNQAKVNITAVSGIIVAIGPGSYNGLRVGVSTAKALAFSLGIPVVGISTLEAEACPYAETGLPICPIHNAGKGEIVAALYRKQRGKWHQLLAEHITTVGALCSRIKTKTLFCGEFAASVAEPIRNALGQKALIVSSPAASLRRAGFLAERGLARLAAGDYDDPRTLQPLYLRHPPISERKHL